MMHKDVPRHRIDAFRRIIRRLEGAERVVLTTHVNADGDGAGSQAAMASWLESLGRTVTVVNPTPFPDAFRFLFPADGIADAGTSAGDAAVRQADIVVVLDTAEASRIGRLARLVEGSRAVVIDHHVRGDSSIGGLEFTDATAAATGELMYDLLVVAEFPRPWPQRVLEGLYTAIVADTGSFRFSNTTPRVHAIAADLLHMGVDPEIMYRRIFGSVPLRRMELLRYALDHLQVDPEYAITSISVERGVMERLEATSEDLDGLIEHARSIDGTEIAIMFRETADGSTKVSLRSAGAADVNAVARQFGGGGHVKASGALVPGGLDAVRPGVLAAARSALDAAGTGFRGSRDSD